MRFDIATDNGAFVYDTDPAALIGPDGERVDLSRFAYSYIEPYADHQILFSPDNPVVGKDSPRVLKIQMGLGCNYACSYCSQGGQVEDKSSAADAKTFLAELDQWLTEAPEKIEFWGGEPMLYWHKLELLAPALLERFPGVRMSVVTNGTLLTRERVQTLFRWGFSMAVSHDGPGQSLRGPDPFDDGDWTALMRETFALFGDRICFNTVITPRNFDLLKTVLWFEQRMGGTVRVNVEDIVTDYGGMRWSHDALAAMAKSIRAAVSSGMALFFPRLRWSVQQFMETLAVEKALTGSHQVCGMDRRDQLAVDLHGAVLTCQNAGAESGHRIGSVQNLPGVSLETSYSWASRPNCVNCPVVHLCYGSCMFLTGKDFESSCRSSYYYNLAILEGAIKLLTGAEVVSVSGWRPKKPFPIPVVTEV